MDKIPHFKCTINFYEEHAMKRSTKSKVSLGAHLGLCTNFPNYLNKLQGQHTKSLMHLLPPSKLVCPFWGIKLFKESKMWSFKHFNFPKLPFNNLKLPKKWKVNVSHQFKSVGVKEEVYHTLAVDFWK